VQHTKVSLVDPGYQLLNCLDCIESDSLLFTRIEKIFATSQGMFRYKEIVCIVIIFLEHSSHISLEVAGSDVSWYALLVHLQAAAAAAAGASDQLQADVATVTRGRRSGSDVEVRARGLLPPAAPH
jgi:hypothetical protein